MSQSTFHHVLLVLRFATAGRDHGAEKSVSSFQEMHGKTAETQVFISTDWIGNIPIRGVALLVSEAIDRHRKKLHAILEILIHMASCRPVYIQAPLTKSGNIIVGKNLTEVVIRSIERFGKGNFVFKIGSRAVGSFR
jgi:hypothetical protein